MLTIDEDETPTSWTAPDLSASDADGDQLTWHVAQEPPNGSLEVSGTGQSPDTFQYTPVSNWNGTETFQLQVTDGNGGADGITVSVTVSPRNDPPVNTVLPEVAGEHEVGKILNADKGTWNDQKDQVPGELTYAYQWQRATDDLGANTEEINAATGSTYKPGVEDEGHYLRVEVTATDNGEGTPSSQQTVAHSVWKQVRKQFFHFLTDEGLSVTFGRYNAATDGLDAEIDLQADVNDSLYFTRPLDQSVQLQRDLRSDKQAISHWYLKLEPDNTTAGSVTLTWDFSWYGGQKQLLAVKQEDSSAAAQPVNLLTTSRLTVAEPTLYEIVLSPTEQLTLELSAGWNLAGTGLISQTPVSSHFPEADALWRWRNGAYQSGSTLDPFYPERAHWIHLPAQDSTVNNGVPADGYINLQPAWNMVTPVSATTISNYDKIVFPIWYWEPTTGLYKAVAADENLQPGKGYWIYAMEAHTISTK